MKLLMTSFSARPIPAERPPATSPSEPVGIRIEQEALTEQLWLYTEEQRPGDGNEQPEEGVDVSGTQIDVFIAIDGEAEHQEVDDCAYQYRVDGKLPLGNIALQPGESVKQPENQEGQEPEEHQHDHLQHTDNQQHRVFGLTRKVLEKRGVVLFFVRTIICFLKFVAQFFHAVLPPQVHLDLIPVVAGTCQNL